MSTQHSLLHKLRTDLRIHDAKLDRGCRQTLGIGVQAFKLFRAITQMLGVLLGFYAMSLGAPPLAALGIALIFYIGPEGAEVILSSRSDG